MMDSYSKMEFEKKTGRAVLEDKLITMRVDTVNWEIKWRVELLMALMIVFRWSTVFSSINWIQYSIIYFLLI